MSTLPSRFSIRSELVAPVHDPRVLLADSKMSSWVDEFRKTPVSGDTMLKILYQIACGMDFLHRHSPPVCHRDLNPNNVLVFQVEYDKLLVKVSDFGLSREFENDVTMTGM